MRLERTAPLTVYMPCVHGARTRGIARSFARIGFRLRLSGKSMAHGPAADTRYAREEARERFGDHVDVYEGSELFDAPPDVMIVGRSDIQPAMTALWMRARRVRPIVLCAYSGVFQSRFDYSAVAGLIATDRPSRVIARYHGTPALKFFPDFDFAAFPFQLSPPTKSIALRSYIIDYARRFPLSHELFEALRERLVSEFGGEVTVENIENARPDRVRELITESAATLHIKEVEGFGWSLLESLSIGRPIIAHAGLARNQAFLEFAEEGRSRFLFERPDELVRIVRRLLVNRRLRFQAQADAAMIVRQRFDSERYAHELAAFLTHLLAIERLRWTPHDPEPPRPIAPYRPSLDPAALQSYEEVALKGKAARPED